VCYLQFSIHSSSHSYAKRNNRNLNSTNCKHKAAKKEISVWKRWKLHVLLSNNNCTIVYYYFEKFCRWLKRYVCVILAVILLLIQTFMGWRIYYINSDTNFSRQDCFWIWRVFEFILGCFDRQSFVLTWDMIVATFLIDLALLFSHIIGLFHQKFKFKLWSEKVNNFKKIQILKIR
jgi:hypothetical protein